MAEHRCCNTASWVRYGFESQYAYKLLRMKPRDRVSFFEMVHIDACHKKTFPLGVVQRGNTSTPTTGTVTIKAEVTSMYRIRVILIKWVGIDRPVYYFLYL